LISGRKYREHSVNYILDEINYMQKNYGINYFDFHDDTFNINNSRINNFAKEIKKRNIKFKWGCFCRVNNFDYKIAKVMKQSGCEVVQFGVESGNQKILNSLNKRITLQDIEIAIISAKKANIKEIACGFIIGNPEDTVETIFDTIHFAKKLVKLGATRLTVSLLTPYPGTHVYINMDTNGVRLITKDWERFIFSRVVMRTKYLNEDTLRELYAKAVYEFLNVTNNKIQAS
jgi:radical SAM superfamily enzyme YgiQ (UPF0313 family)